MRIASLLVVSALAAALGSSPALAFTMPDHIAGADRMKLESQQDYAPEEMYRQVNGEAVIFESYGAKGLKHALYSGPSGEVSIDMLEAGNPFSAYGLYAKYAGCEDSAPELDGGDYLISPSEKCGFAFKGAYFFRICFFAEGGYAQVYQSVLTALSGAGLEGQIPPEVRLLRKEAPRPCELRYGPVKAGEGLEIFAFSWPFGGETAHLGVSLESARQKDLSEKLKARGVESILASKGIVGWYENGKGDMSKLSRIIEALNAETR